MASRVGQITQVKTERVLYRTITPNLDLWQGTGELKTLVNEQSVIQALKNLVSTYPGERFYHLDIGSLLVRGLFEFADQFTADRISAELQNTIATYEPRATNLQITVTPFAEQHYLNVNIQFTLAATGVVVQVPTIVLRTR